MILNFLFYTTASLKTCPSAFVIICHSDVLTTYLIVISLIFLFVHFISTLTNIFPFAQIVNVTHTLPWLSFRLVYDIFHLGMVLKAQNNCM